MTYQETWPQKRYSKKKFFFIHLKLKNNEVVVSGIARRGDSYKEKAEAVNRLLKDTCTEENMHFICHSNINVKQHLTRSNLHRNDHDISVFKLFLNNFKSIWLQKKHNVLIAGHGSLSSENSELPISIYKDILRIPKQRVDSALNTITGVI